jgi:hypothetical protein
MVELPTPRNPDAPPKAAPDQISLPSSKGATGYETRDIRLKPIAVAAVALVVAAAFTHAAMWGLFELFEARELRRKASDRPIARELRRTQPPEPRLQSTPLDDLAALHAWEERLLTTYAILDSQAGTVRIPIERAMELVVERGLPARPAAPTRGTARKHTEASQAASDAADTPGATAEPKGAAPGAEKGSTAPRARSPEEAPKDAPKDARKGAGAAATGAARPAAEGAR